MTSAVQNNFYQGFAPKKDKKKNVGGALAALLAAGATKSVPKNIIAPKLLEQLKAPNLELTEDQITIANTGAKKVFDEIAGLSKKGVKFNDYQNVPVSEFVKESGDIKKDLNANLTEAIKSMLGEPVANGNNALFVGKSQNWIEEAMKNAGLESNSINVNMKKLPLASFHEMGHAYNFNNSAFWKTIQKASKVKLLAPLFIIIPALTKEHRPQEGQELTKKEKFVNGLRKACPFLAGATMLPTLLEEGMATLRGNKWAKEVFKDTPELAKKVAKGNKWGYASYALAASLTVLASFVAKKIKDKSDKNLVFMADKNNKMLEKGLGYHQGRS